MSFTKFKERLEQKKNPIEKESITPKTATVYTVETEEQIKSKNKKNKKGDK